jgi:hypothetical protein
MTLPSGTRLGSYELTRPIGAGGMGEVYGAKDARLDYPSWSRDGKRIYFSVARKSGDVYVLEGF